MILRKKMVCNSATYVGIITINLTFKVIDLGSLFRNGSSKKNKVLQLIGNKLFDNFYRYRLTKIAVDSAAGPYQNHTVVFLGSERGVVLKFLARTGYSGFLTDSLFLEEMNVYNAEKYVFSCVLYVFFYVCLYYDDVTHIAKR